MPRTQKIVSLEYLRLKDQFCTLIVQAAMKDPHSQNMVLPLLMDSFYSNQNHFSDIEDSQEFRDFYSTLDEESRTLIDTFFIDNRDLFLDQRDWTDMRSAGIAAKLRELMNSNSN